MMEGKQLLEILLSDTFKLSKLGNALASPLNRILAPSEAILFELKLRFFNRYPFKF